MKNEKGNILMAKASEEDEENVDGGEKKRRWNELK